MCVFFIVNTKIDMFSLFMMSILTFAWVFFSLSFHLPFFLLLSNMSKQWFNIVSSYLSLLFFCCLMVKLTHFESQFFPRHYYQPSKCFWFCIHKLHELLRVKAILEWRKYINSSVGVRNKNKTKHFIESAKEVRKKNWHVHYKMDAFVVHRC